MKSPQAALTTATARAQTSCPVDRLVATGKFATAGVQRESYHRTKEEVATTAKVCRFP